MSKQLLLALTVASAISSCSSKLNQIKNDKREGKWITTDTFATIYTSKGRFQNGTEKGKWKYYDDDKLVKMEKYRKDICKTTYYYPNGKIRKEGKTKFESDSIENHWYYIGKWSFYKENGKLDSIAIYKKENTTDIPINSTD
ncbi:toxin-antitoxin system YwqK family antitoxin [Flavobacterium algicola]|uniref:hypothetical protein n=1 Tax=Flavobacterium algicola TaxID=556529 RepID=UPI001EFD396D|nr:hypothetical protein [Flavobacterium algicola]MCG9791111.1 hypothetical protein [Flavobacterium algicola]